MDLYLKEVQMENFKSFGKRLTVPFFQGFTAITGPNGSGKSNIADAILFVLGPRSSKVMRAGRLTDLIFNGGKKRKNPANHCKVSLLFDNKQRKMPINNDEVTLTKMIKRAPLKDNPDNYYTYYYINGKSSSYSEFSNVLLHARISGDGYNIVKQGDVTSIIEMGGVERRRLIDEIAGISHFDEDIKKAEKEKADVDSNMERIRIILREIDAQLKQLKNDRDEAIRYKELKDKLYTIKAKITEKKKQEVQSQITEINQQIQSYEKEQKTLHTTAKALKKDYTDAQEDLKAIEKQIAEVGGDEVKEINGQIDALRTDEIKAEERVNYSVDEIREIQQDISRQQQRLRCIEEELSEHKKQQTELSDRINEKQSLLTEKNEIVAQLKEEIAHTDDTSMDLSTELKQLRKEYDSKQSRLHENKLSLQRIQDQFERIEEQILELQEDASTYAFEQKDINWQKEEIQKAKQTTRSQQRKIEKKLIDQKKQESELTQQLHELDRSIRRLQQEQAKLQAEFEAAESIRKRYNRAVTELIKARDNGTLQGIHGTIAELAHVNDTYKTAMAIAAGGRMQSIIVDDDKAAADAIKFLQQKHLGRATFLPLNKMIAGRPRGKALMAVKDEHAHGFAIDLVEYQKKYEGAFWYVFGDTVVVEGIHDARRLMGGVRLVDLSGTLIEASGAMKGGSKPRSRLQFAETNRKKLDQTIQNLSEAKQHQETVEQDLQQIKTTIASLEEQIRGFQPAEMQQQIDELDKRKKTITEKHNNIQKLLEEKTNEKDILQNKQQEVQHQIDLITKDLTDIEEKKEQKGKLLLKGSSKETAQKTRVLEEEVTDLRNQVLHLTSEQEAIGKKIELLTERKQEVEENTSNLTEEITKLKQSIEQYKQQRENAREQIETLSTVQNQITDKIKQFSGKRDQKYKETVTIENKLDKINTRIESYFDLISRAKYRLPTLEGTIKELNEELKLYGVDVNLEHLPPVESLKESLKITEESMRELEPVNMRALDEYDHQEQRKNKLDEDVSHLKQQRKNLMKLVNEITKKKKNQFYEVFKEINQNFKEIYAKLSEGGEAELQLENPDNLFDSGLTIKARPRGKKVLLLSALSGGEKSIASLALIFAVQHYDPSPFYVLDEVDMFLDGVNAENVSRMVKQNAADSQFIMVSLRKIALKEANHVYGVTMHDDGISDMIGNVDPNAVGLEGEILIHGG